MGKKGGHCAGAEQRQWRDVTEAMTSVAERGGAWSIPFASINPTNQRTNLS